MNPNFLVKVKESGNCNFLKFMRVHVQQQPWKSFSSDLQMWIQFQLKLNQAFSTLSKINHFKTSIPVAAAIGITQSRIIGNQNLQDRQSHPGKLQERQSPNTKRQKLDWKHNSSQAISKRRSILPLLRTPSEDLFEQIRIKKWETALKVFDFMKGQNNYTPDVGIYIQLFEMLGDCKQPQIATRLFQEMIKDGCSPCTEAYTALLSVYTHSNRLNLALSTFEGMKQQPNCSPNVFTYTLMIKACSDACEFDLVSKLLLEMKSVGIEPTTMAYNGLLDAYGKAGHLERMENLFLSLVKDCIFKPDVWTQNMMLKNLGKWGHVTKMEDWYERFAKSGVQPDITTFNTLMNVYGKEQSFEKMLAVMEYMKRYHYNPDTISYNIMINAYGKAGMVEQMQKVFNFMKFEGVRPDSITFCSLINAYGAQGIVNKVKKLLQQLKNHHVVPDVAVYNSALNAYRKAKNICEMERLFLEMKEVECFPDAVSYNIMIDAFKSNGLESRADELLLQSQETASRRKLYSS